MGVNLIDTSRIEAMVTQLKNAASQAKGISAPLGLASQAQETGAAGKVDFAQALKTSLDQVNSVQQKSEQLSQKFALGDESISLSDMMISMQKANITLQATVQVRNKLVSAYQDIMNMQI